MRIWQRLVFTIMISAFLTLFVSAQEDISPTPDSNTIIVDSAFVRSGPSNDYLAVGALYEGDTVTPLNISEDGLWILIPYSRTNGWIQRNLVSWQDETTLNQLPILSANVTPTPRVAIINTPFIPTATPEGNYVNLEGAASAYLRAGPGRGYLRLGQLLPGEAVEAISRNEDITWIMVRFSDDVLPDEFAWVAIELVYWEDYQALSDLPVINADNLTPTATLTPSLTPSITATGSATFTSTPEPTPTHTATATSTPEPTLTNTATTTNTPEPTLTNTATATSAPTLTDTATNTPEPSATSTETATNTPEPTVTATLTLTLTNVPTNTVEPTATDTNTPTNTASPEPTVMNTASVTPQPTNTEVQEVAIVVSDTDIPRPTNTATATTTPSATVQITDIFAVQGTSVAVEATNSALNINTNDAEIIEESTESNSISIPFEAIVGLIILLIVLSYSWFYWQGLRAIGRYDDGFVINDCPVCKRGSLSIEERNTRIFGIPSAKRTIRCDECRSILRETGTKRWRYAVDRIENPTLFDRFNGREVSDADLQRLEKIAPQGASPRTSPEFLDDDSED